MSMTLIETALTREFLYSHCHFHKTHILMHSLNKATAAKLSHYFTSSLEGPPAQEIFWPIIMFYQHSKAWKFPFQICGNLKTFLGSKKIQQIFNFECCFVWLKRSCQLKPFFLNRAAEMVLNIVETVKIL